MFGYDDASSGAAVADVDADGDLDVFLTRIGGPNSLYLNDGTGRFTDVAERAGVAGPEERFGSSAAAFADFDADGHLDLFVSGARGGKDELFMNAGDTTFTDEAAARGFDSHGQPSAGLASSLHDVAVADVNGDGYMDLLLLEWYSQLVGERASRVVSEVLGESRAPATGSVLCAQIDAIRTAGFPRDPGTPESRSALMINDGTGHFSDASEEFGLPFEEIMALTGSFADFDGDGWQDLAITGDNCTSRLFRNVEGSRFEDVTSAAGVATDENGMGSVVRDLNRDGLPDWFVTSISYPTRQGICVSKAFQIGCSGNRLFLNKGGFVFTDSTDDYGLRDGGWGWGAAIEDLDHNGELEVVMTNGYLNDPDHATPDDPDFWPTFANDTTRLWQSTNGRYEDVAAEAGIDDDTVGHALVTFDVDHDGDLDLLVVPSGEQTPRLWRNNTIPAALSSPEEGHNWLTVRLDDPSSPGNHWGDGAVVKVFVSDDSEPIVQWVTTGGSYESQKPPVLHFGLGSHPGPVASVEVLWPHSRTAQVLTGVETGRELTVVRPPVP